MKKKELLSRLLAAFILSICVYTHSSQSEVFDKKAAKQVASTILSSTKSTMAHNLAIAKLAADFMGVSRYIEQPHRIIQAQVEKQSNFNTVAEKWLSNTKNSQSFSIESKIAHDNSYGFLSSKTSISSLKSVDVPALPTFGLSKKSEIFTLKTSKQSPNIRLGATQEVVSYYKDLCDSSNVQKFLTNMLDAHKSATACLSSQELTQNSLMYEKKLDTAYMDLYHTDSKVPVLQYALEGLKLDPKVHSLQDYTEAIRIQEQVLTIQFYKNCLWHNAQLLEAHKIESLKIAESYSKQLNNLAIPELKEMISDASKQVSTHEDVINQRKAVIESELSKVKTFDESIPQLKGLKLMTAVGQRETALQQAASFDAANRVSIHKVQDLNIQITEAKRLLKQKISQYQIDLKNIQKTLSQIDENGLLCDGDKKLKTAVNLTLFDQGKVEYKAYNALTQEAKNLLIECKISPEKFETLTGDALQKHLFEQVGGTLNSTAKFISKSGNDKSLVEKARTVVLVCDTAVKAIKNGNSSEAIAITKWSQFLYDVAAGAVNGAAIGIKDGITNTAHIFLHPNETFNNFANVAIKFYEINALNLRTALGQDVSKEYAEIGKNIESTAIVISHQIEGFAKLSLPQKIENCVQLATEMITEGLLFNAGLRATTKLGALSKAKALAALGKTGELIAIQTNLHKKEVDGLKLVTAEMIDTAATVETKVAKEAQTIVHEIDQLASTSILSIESFNFSMKANEHFKNAARTIPIQTLSDIIKMPLHITKDPKGSTALMYYSRFYKNGKLYNVEVLYEKTQNVIWHFKYTESALGPLSEIK